MSCPVWKLPCMDDWFLVLAVVGAVLAMAGVCTFLFLA
jgi:hypothetical protein